jgi:putative restriction endonuclease
MPKSIYFGEIKGIKEGHHFNDRKVMMENSFHRNWAAGIDGNGKDGTSAIVLSGGYEDDEDHGDEIIYTGAGGNKDGKQVENQSWENRGNAGLLKSMNEGLPVRVIRGHKHKSKYSPRKGYTYAGLYSVVDAWEETGKSGFKICRFRLVYSGDNQKRRSAEEVELDHSTREKRRSEGTVLRIVRDTNISTELKKVYSYKCQVCSLVINTRNGYYAEGAHIRPLGKPHNGDDSIANLLCLCPNHHVMFDKGCFSVDDDFKLIGDEAGELNIHPQHNIDSGNLKYHRKAHGYD